MHIVVKSDEWTNKEEKKVSPQPPAASVSDQLEGLQIKKVFALFFLLLSSGFNSIVRIPIDDNNNNNAKITKSPQSLESSHWSPLIAQPYKFYSTS